MFNVLAAVIGLAAFSAILTPLPVRQQASV